MPKTMIYKEKKIRLTKAEKGRRRSGRKGWLQQVIDPHEEQHPLTFASGGRAHITQQKRSMDKARAKKAILNPSSLRVFKQAERLAWMTDKICLGWDNRKITYEFMKQFNVNKRSAAKYIKKCYTDFQKQFTDESKRTTLMGQHCATLKSYAGRAMDSGDGVAAEKLLRQYAEVVGVLVAPSMIKFQKDDNRQQIFVGNDEMKATLSVLENLSESDLFKEAYANRPAQRLIEASPIEVDADGQTTAVGILDRET